jgi:hypothetical protein
LEGRSLGDETKGGRQETWGQENNKKEYGANSKIIEMEDTTEWSREG